MVSGSKLDLVDNFGSKLKILSTFNLENIKVIRKKNRVIGTYGKKQEFLSKTSFWHNQFCIFFVIQK